MRPQKLTRVYIPSQRKVVVSSDVEFDKDIWSSKCQEPPTMTMEVEELLISKTNSNQQTSKGAKGASLPFN